MQWLEYFFGAGISEMFVIEHVVMADGAVLLHQPLANIKSLHTIQSLGLLLNQLIDLCVLLAQHIRLLTPW